MANVASNQIIEPIKVTIVADNPIDTIEDRHVLTAHRMVEQYLSSPIPQSRITATYTITDRLAPLPAILNYPINKVLKVLAPNNIAILNTTNDDRFVWSEAAWTPTVILQYEGGIEQQVFDALIRQAEVLQQRNNVSPEQTALDIAGEINEKWSPQFRSGLAPDVKQMLFPYRKLGF